MQKIIKTFLITIICACAAIVLLLLVLETTGKGSFRLMLPVEHKTIYNPPSGAQYPPALQASGNRLVDNAGNPVRLRGVMIPDPYRLDGEKRFRQALIADIRQIGANVVRVPVHPEFWHRDPDYLWRYLDPIVTWAGENGLYVIIDLHFIGNIATGAGDQMPDINLSPTEFAGQFWTQVAPYFRDAPHVLFEIYNEPADIGPLEWRSNAGHLVELIRSQGITQPIIVGGTEYARDLSWVLQDPLEDINIVYASHIYPAHSQYDWPHWFGEVAAQYPVLITEWGYLDPDNVNGPDYLAGSREAYGEPFLTYLDEIGAGWVACWYDDQWLPPMFAPGGETLNAYGQWVLDKLR